MVWRCTRNTRLIQAQGHASNRSCFTLRSTSTAKSQHRGRGSFCQEGEKGLTWETTIACSSYLITARAGLGLLNIAGWLLSPTSKGEEAARLFLPERKGEPWQAGLESPAFTRDRQSERQTSPSSSGLVENPMLSLCKGKLASQVSGMNKHCTWTLPFCSSCCPKEQTQCLGAGCLMLLVTVPWIWVQLSHLSTWPAFPDSYGSPCAERRGGVKVIFWCVVTGRALTLFCCGCSIPASVGGLSVGQVLGFGTAQKGNRKKHRALQKGRFWVTFSRRCS